MSDEPGFDFRRPPERREAKRFEPPPWEKEAFEEFSRARDEEPTAAIAGLPETDATSETVRGEQAAGGGDARPEDVGVDGMALSQPAKDGGDEGSPLEEARVIEMMARLAEEEPKIHEKTWAPAIFSAMVLGALGIVMTIWGGAAMTKVRAGGATVLSGAMVLLLFGLGFVALAVWLAVRILRQRGVL